MVRIAWGVFLFTVSNHDAGKLVDGNRAPGDGSLPLGMGVFIPFIMSTTFTVLNLFIGIIVSAMQAEHEQDAADDRSQLHDDQKAILSEMRLMRAELQELRAETRHKS